MLWGIWWKLASRLRGACARTRTFLWMIVCLAGMTVRMDLPGVTSIVRALPTPSGMPRPDLRTFCTARLWISGKLTRLWRNLAFKQPGILRFNGKPVLVGDGVKVAKSGKRMPAVKKLHQQSESNTKPEYIFEHSCQAEALLMRAASSVFAVPLACRIHEGVVFSNRDKRTLLDKMILLVDSLSRDRAVLLRRRRLLEPRAKSFADCSRKGTTWSRESGKRGRPRKYGEKVQLASLLDNEDAFSPAKSPIYGETGVKLRYRTIDLLWRPVGILAHCRYPIHTSVLEGINNKIKVIKRVAYGYRDEEYFFLKIRGAFRPVTHT